MQIIDKYNIEIDLDYYNASQCVGWRYACDYYDGSDMTNQQFVIRLFGITLSVVRKMETIKNSGSGDGYG